jgi:ABC-type cobalamin/Fe3+-siderophores transport system ATPase subunit
MTFLLEARGLSVGYGQRIIAADISFALEPGKVLCLLGPNGGGKTTLLRTLLGLLPPLAGEVRLGDQALPALSRRDLTFRISQPSVCLRVNATVPNRRTRRDVTRRSLTADDAPHACPPNRDEDRPAADRGTEGPGC